VSRMSNASSISFLYAHSGPGAGQQHDNAGAGARTRPSHGVRAAGQTCCSVSVSLGGIFDFFSFPFFPLAIANGCPSRTHGSLAG
jgi:hypothetical protein